MVSVFVLHFTGRTQTIDSIFTRLALEYPHEKIYVHTDRDAYIAGETIWMKMYIANSSFNQAVGTTVYTELTDMQGNLINRSKWPVVANATVGQIELPDRMQGGHYLLKAYTSWMMNFDSSFFFKKSLVITDTSGMYEMIKVQEGDFTVDIFPEGGRIISGAMNNIAFKAINSKGLPVDVKGYLDDGSGLTENRIDISAYHDGMGKFQLTHEEGKEYSLVMTAAGVEKRFPLPKADKDGVT
ncbi:MAG TPA: MG2 domain-containing protein, partial [Parasegetibacter sp.]